MIREMKRFETNSFLKCLQFLLILLVSLLFVLPAYSEGFKLKKVGSHYEPELHYYKSFTLPGTNIKAGAYRYASNDGNEVPKLGFLVGNQFYFVQEDTCSCGDLIYGVTREEYFLVDGWAYGSSGHNRRMYLFKYNQNSVQLLDVIGQAYVASYGMDFTSAYPGKPKYGSLGSKNPPVWIINDIDNAGKLKVRIKVYMEDKSPPAFDLYLEIKNNRLHVNFNPELYKPLFEDIKRKHKGTKPVSYYTYGFLVKQMDLKRIKAELIGDKHRSYIIELLENVDKWDSAFHDLGDEKFELLEYRLNRR